MPRKPGVRMRMHQRYLLPSLPAILLITSFCPPSASAKKFAGEFMALGGGARALGMGSAFAAVASDASAVFWNPAGLSALGARQAMFMHSERFGQLVNYDFAAYVMPSDLFTPGGAIGFGVIHMGVDDIIITSGLQYEENNTIAGFQPEDGDRLIYDMNSLPKESNNDFAFLGSYSLPTRYGRLGGTLKLLYTDAVAGYRSFGFGFDFGFMQEELFPGLSVGLKLQDATGTYISWSSGTNEFISPALKLGLAYRFAPAPLRGSLLLALDGDFYFENRRGASQFWMGRYSSDLHLGAELDFQGKVMIRGGLDAGNPTAGAGLRIGFLGFDYAYLHHDAFEATHRVSASAEF